MATTPNGIPLLDGTSTVNPIQTPLNAMANAVDTALNGIAAGKAQSFKGTAASRPSITGMAEGDTFQETDGAKLLWVYRAPSWFIAPGQVLASMIGPTTNVAGTNLIVGSVISTPVLPVGQRIKIIGSCSGYCTTSASFGEASVQWRNNAADVSATVFDKAQTRRFYSASGNFVGSDGAYSALHVTTVAAKVSAALYTKNAITGVYGADATHLWIESA